MTLIPPDNRKVIRPTDPLTNEPNPEFSRFPLPAVVAIDYLLTDTSDSSDTSRASGIAIAPGDGSTGTVAEITGTRRIVYTPNVDTASGHSGSGIWHQLEGDEKPRVMAIHSTGPTPAPNRPEFAFPTLSNGGVLITTDIYGSIMDRIAEDSGTANADILPENAIIGTDPFISLDGKDDITGTYRRERIIGKGDDDILRGMGADDRLEGDDGDDTLKGNDGNDSLEGGNDDDLLQGFIGNDELNGDGGKDRLFGNGGSDLLNGGTNNDYLAGSDGNDTLIGESGNDTLIGGINDDELNGGGNNDRLFGQDGNDILEGGNGRDYIQGNLDDDILEGGANHDTMIP